MSSDHEISIHRIVEEQLLTPVFQPIVDFRIRGFLGYEALIRGPEGSSLHSPAALFAAAQEAGIAHQLEHAAREASLRVFALSNLSGRLFLNVTPGVLLSEEWMNGRTKKLLSELGLAENRIVIELTENEQITCLPALHDVLLYFRGRGFQIAIDDLGEGFANLRMWSEVRPEFVKIDRHFVDGIAGDRMKFHFVRAMQDLAESCSATLIAEGIERAEDLACIHSMGIACGQGFFIARPAKQPPRSMPAQVGDMLAAKGLALPPTRTQGVTTRTARELLRAIDPVAPDTPNEDVCARFEQDPSLDVLPVVCAGVPVGIINRHSMIDRFARPFRKELYGRRSCHLFMDPTPLVVDQHATIQELAMILAQAPKHYLFDGFIVTGEGRYLGVGSSHALIATITEMQISAARYANPLTQLPGNVPINEHVDRLLARGAPFVAAYVDIDNFKPFNDTFGYRRGDDVILLLAKCICKHAEDRSDFVGHIGGDDFFVTFQSADWELRCHAIMQEFSEAMHEQGVIGSSMSGGSYLAENRRGEIVAQMLPTLSIGAVRVGPGEYDSHREVAAAASEAKKQAKKMARRQPSECFSGQFFIERRQPLVRPAAHAEGYLAN